MKAVISKPVRGEAEMFLKHRQLVLKVVSRWHIPMPELTDYEDLIAAGNIGLLRAIRSFNPKLGNKFSTYAYPSIARCIARFTEGRKGRDFTELFTKQCSEKGRLPVTIRVGQLNSRDRQAIEYDSLSFSEDKDVAMDNKTKLRFIKQALSEMPSDLRQIIEGVYFQGKTLRQLGKEMGYHPEWIRQKKVQAEKMLAGELDFLR